MSTPNLSTGSLALDAALAEIRGKRRAAQIDAAVREMRARKTRIQGHIAQTFCPPPRKAPR